MKKYTTAAIIRNVSSALMNRPMFTSSNVTVPKSGRPPILPTKPSSTPVNVVTTVAKAPPTMNAVASSTRLPRMTNSLKPLITCCSSMLGCQKRPR